MAAQDAELKLKVSLDLAFFRQQLASLGQAAAGYNIPVNVRFDRRSVQNELNALQTNIRRRNYRLNVETNLSAEIEKADTLARKLGELSRKIQSFRGGTGVASGRQAVAQIEEVLRGGLSGQAFGLQRAQENIAKQAILSRLEKQSLGKGGYNVAGLEKIIRDLGGTPSGKRSDLVAQAKKLVKESDGIADAVFDNLKDLQMKLRPIRGQAQTSASRSMPNLNRMLDQIANLTENPRAAQRMLRMLPENRITTDLIGAANRQAAFKEQFPSGYRLPGFNAPKAFDPLLKTIAKDFSDYTKTVNITDPWVGKIGDGIRRIVAVSAQAATTTKALPPTGGTASPLNTLEQKLAQSRGILGTGGGVAGAMFTGRGVVNPGLSMLSPIGISGNYRQMAAALANQAANPSLAHRQIADIGFGGVPTAATGLSGQALNRALNQAFLQRRGLSGAGSQTMPLFQTAGVPIQQTIPGMAYRMGGGTMGGSMGMFPMAGMMGPSTPLTINARTSMFGAGGPPNPPPPGGGGGGGGMGGFGRAMGGINLPGAGTIRELGSEFAFATKQVLLFGQAYKLLGFIQAFPGQVGQAVAQLQSFRNTLNAVSPTAEEAAASNRLILDLVEKYNVPLQSARDGFTKLYASMAPSGFKGDEIRELFTGITKAAATFGMSAIKVDRVNYAFAQMASKGQVMSEELKGQLGDVLPGAMALFAEAAGFKGPKAIQDFSAALEDGRYKGEAMVALLKNVGIVMNKEFGPGAEGAALTFQGIINRMQNSMKLLYESLEPVAVEFLNAVVVPLIDGIKQLSDGFTAFFSGSAAKTAGGFAIAQELERLKPAFDGIRANAAQLGQVFAQFGKIALDVAKVLLQIAGNPFVGYLARVYLNVLMLTTAIQILNLRALVPLIANFTRSAYALIAFTVQCAKAGQASQVMGLMVRTAGITLRTFFAATGVGLVLVGISLLIERFSSLSQQMQDVRDKAIGAAQAIRAMSQTEARAEEFKRRAGVKLLENISTRKGLPSRKTGTSPATEMIYVNAQETAQLEALGIPVQKSVIPGLPGGMVARQDVAGRIQEQQGLMREAEFRQTQIKFDEKQALQPVQLGAIPPSEAEGKTRGGKELKDFTSDQVRLLQSRLELTKRYISTQIELSKRQRELSIADTEYAFGLKIIEAQYAEAVRQANEYKEAQRAAALQEAKNFKTIAEQETVYEYRKALLGDLLDLSDQYDKQTSELNTSIAALTQGELKLTEAAKLEALIAQQTTGYKADQLEVVKPLLDKLRAQAKVLDDLADKEKKLRDAIEKRQELEKKIKEKLTDLRQEIQLLRAVNDEEARRLRIAQEYEGATKEQLSKIYDLEKIRDNIKAVRELIDSFVTDTTSDYKNFLGEIISGKDAGDALREFQKSLKDRVLKIFLDFSMAPVEKFFKESLGQFALDKLFPKADIETEETKKETALEANTAALNRLTDAITTPAVSPDVPQAPGNGPVAIPVIPDAASETTEALAQAFANDASLFASSISSVDSSLKDATISIANAAEEASPNGATGKKWQQSLGAAVQGIGIAAGSIMGIMAGISQMKEGGTSNVLGGIGSIALSLGSLLGGIGSLGGLFGGGASAAGDVAGNLAKAPFAPKLGPVFANGGIAKGGFRAFANGGIVTGPTLGLVGEGRFSEAVVPLPNGRSIPVQLGGRTARDLMGGNAPGMPQQTSLNMSFETTKINGTEYVSREQLERAMAETRRASIAGGARQGMSMTLDRIQQSPSVRSRIGIR